ncbi:MAG: DUF3143 domain-containing protein [Aphanocapsa feldmannii 277cV]|uniref:DUF3143 domain-containing protein n=2 Tax=Aphanocapsa feldmannii TaxID=192050 RepID=A0A524RPN7_9CHRO|nr:MAG: DUF3143 domain-containing protein [Aphanocapsa feldmannii 277cV]
MPLPSADTPLSQHSLPALEQWLKESGCRRDARDPCLWKLSQPRWHAELCLEVEEIEVRWTSAEGSSLRAFSYGLSRADVERAILAGP